MTDFFALLDQPRRPWLDPEGVKEAFHQRSRERHPDQLAADADPGDDFAELNAAQQTLREPKSRLKHLLALEFPSIAVSGPAAVPPALADLLFPTQALLGKLDAFLARQAAAPGALARALLAGEQFALREEAEARLAEFESQHAALLNELHVFDTQYWNARPPDAGAALLGFYHGFAYLTRWIEQFHERVYQLSV